MDVEREIKIYEVMDEMDIDDVDVAAALLDLWENTEEED